MQKCLGSGPSLFSLLINDRLWGGPARCQPCSLVVSASRMCLCFFFGGWEPCDEVSLPVASTSAFALPRPHGSAVPALQH